MKCPWMKKTKAYADYSEGDVSGRPIQVVEEEFKECIKKECPFYGDKYTLCFRSGVEVKTHE